MSETFLDRTQSLNDLRGMGERADIMSGFSLYGRERRVEILQAIDKDLAEGSDLRKLADEWRTRQRLGEVHDALLKANR